MNSPFKSPSTPILATVMFLLLVVAIAILYTAYQRNKYYTSSLFVNYIESAEANGETENAILHMEHGVRYLRLTLISVAWALLGVTAYSLYLTWLVHRERDERDN